MYRADEPAFCRSCGKGWQPGTSACAACGEPLARPASDSRPRYRSQVGRVRRLQIGLGLCGITMLLMMSTQWEVADFLSRVAEGEIVTETDGEAVDGPALKAALGHIIIYMVCVGMFSQWVIEAGRNLRVLGVTGTKYAEEWRAIWFFVPLARWVMSLLSIRELFRASAGGRDWDKGPTGGLVYLWWIAWLGCILAWDATLVSSAMMESDLEVIITMQRCLIGATALKLTAGGLLALLVGQIDRRIQALAAASPLGIPVEH